MATTYIYTHITEGNTPVTVVYESSDCNDFTIQMAINNDGTVISNNPFTVQIDVIPALIELEINYDTNDCDDFTITATATSAEGDYCQGTDCTVVIPYTISSTTCIIAPDIDYNCTDGLIINNYNANYNYNFNQGQFFPANQPITVTVTNPLDGCTNSTSFIAPDCCEDIIITPEYDCDTHDLTITLSGPGSAGVDILFVSINPPTPPNSSCPYTVLNPLYDNPLGGSSPLVIPQALCDGTYLIEIIVSLTNNCTTSLMLAVDCACNCADTFILNYTDGSEAGCAGNTIAVTPTIGPVGSVILNNGEAEVNNVEVCVDCKTTDIIILTDVSNSICETWGTPAETAANPNNTYMSQGISYLLSTLDIDNNNGINLGFISYDNTSSTPIVNIPLGANALTITNGISQTNTFVENNCNPTNPCSLDGSGWVNDIITNHIIPQFSASLATKKILIFISDGITNQSINTVFDTLISDDVIIVSLHNTINKITCTSNASTCDACENMKCYTIGEDLSGTCFVSYACTCTATNNFYFNINSYTDSVNNFSFLYEIKDMLIKLSDSNLHKDGISAFGALFQTLCCGVKELKIVSKDCNACETIIASGSIINVI